MRQLCTTTAYLALGFANLLFASLVAVLALVERRGTLWWPASRMWAHTIYAGAWSRVRSMGFEGLEWNQPCILMANHESYMDVPAIIASCPVPIRFVARREVFKTPVLGQAMWMTGQISVDRSDREKSIKSLDRAAEKIASGRTVLVFPEGTRTADGELQPFKKGGFMLAIKAQVPIVPIGVSGTRSIVPRGAKSFRPGLVGVVVGEPIETGGLTVADRDDLMDQVHASLVKQRERAARLCAKKSTTDLNN
jgi:1-acyl-sn-glycerol-3-phosphate acyltransferase